LKAAVTALSVIGLNAAPDCWKASCIAHGDGRRQGRDREQPLFRRDHAKRRLDQKATVTSGAGEETAYTYVGAIDNGLLVVPAAYSGGGSGDFITLHIFDVTAAHAFDLAGKVYERIDRTDLRRVALGDGWDGEVSIAKDAIRVVTARKGPADDSGARETMTIVARRP
jgi:hypothetical protein